MSVVATVKVVDGIVLGCESMTQIFASVPNQPQPQLVKAYDNARKIFQVADFPVGILTYGIGNIGRRSIENFVHEFSRSEKARADQQIAENRPRQLNVEQMAGRFYAFMQNHHNQAFGAAPAPAPAPARPVLGFIIAGYSDDEAQHLASEWEFVLPNHNAPQLVVPQDQVGASWRGIGIPFSRLMFGYDPMLEQILTQAGMPPAEVARFRQAVRRIQTAVIFDGMPLQDAVGYCRFIIQTTIGWCTYAAGAPACGGPIRMATITRGGGFEWVTPLKHYLEGEKAHDH